jgi:biotin/methionine sulfoxide reductase
VSAEISEELVGTHWGNFRVAAKDGMPVAVRPFEGDDNPAGFGASLLDALDADVRIPQPMIRAGWLGKRAGSGSGRGLEPFVPVPWDEALDMAAAEIDRVRGVHGNGAIYGGSYGWSSAGRFHHAQSQLHRFLNLIGGYVRSVNTYSAAAAEVIVPHIMGINPLAGLEPNWEDMAEHAELIVAFGGICLRNNQVVPGGVANHTDRDQLRNVAGKGTEIVNIGPLRDDIPGFMPQTWIPCRPSTDTALMLGMAHTLVSENLHDAGFLETHCVGFPQFLDYLTGRSDGVAKDADWASAISHVPAETISNLARRMRAKRTTVTVSLSLQRAEHGEQPYWMATVLAAMLGQIGLPGGGVGYAWGSNGRGFFGNRRTGFSWGRVEQGGNPVKDFIPVARISDMLLGPGEAYDYDGERRNFPDIRLVYWAGGNPFHHHQDLVKLTRAWSRPDTIIVHDSVWTATARRADIVFPATTFMERNDIVCGLGPTVTPSRRAVAPYGHSRDDFDIFAGLARRLGAEPAFTEGRGEMDWLREIYRQTTANAASQGISLPSFPEFWEGSGIDVSDQLAESRKPLALFREDPARHPLATPSGRIEIFSKTIASFGYHDCPGHPAWMDKREWLGAVRARQFPLHLLSPQPTNRLHSQLDFGRASRAGKVGNREPVLINPADAAARRIAGGDVVRIYNDRGAFLAGAVLTDSLTAGVVQVATGAWFDPDPETGLERHGNPNVVCADIGTSSLAQGPSAQSCLVEIERYVGVEMSPRAFGQPATIARAS